MHFFKFSSLEFRHISFRYKIINILTLIIFLIFLTVLFYLQILKGDFFYRLSEKNRLRLVKIKAPRGMIYDRKKEILADSITSFMITFYPWEIQKEIIMRVIEQLEKNLNIPNSQIREKIKQAKKYSYITLKKEASLEEITFIEEHKSTLPGVEVFVQPKRRYKYPEECNHLLGFLGEINEKELKEMQWLGYKSSDYIGKAGVEKAYDQYLKGEDGGMAMVVDAMGRQVSYQNEISLLPQMGKNVILNIDLSLQKRAYESLKNYKGAVVVLNPNNGEVLALVSTPSFNLTHSSSQNLATKKYSYINRCFQGQYVPGSIFKLISAFAFCEKRKEVNLAKFIPCHSEYIKGRFIYKCWEKEGHGSLDLTKALAYSCNVFFYQVGEKVGVDLLCNYAKIFGLGQFTGLDISDEKKGFVPSANWKREKIKSRWHTGDTIQMAIGQGYTLVTPIQMANLIAAVANGGLLFQPSIVNRIEDFHGNILFLKKKKPRGKISIGEKTLSLVKQGLWEAVNLESGTGKACRLEKIEVAGKTGTAQICKMAEKALSIESLPERLRPHAWFIGYAPFKNPQIALAVVVEHGGYGGGIATTIAREIFEEYFRK